MLNSLYSLRFRKSALFLDSENTKTYILIPKVHENIDCNATLRTFRSKKNTKTK